MLKIRLQRAGRKKRPYYHVVVAEKHEAANKKYVQRLGGYNPLEENGFKVDPEKIFEWMDKGAQPSNTVARLMKGFLSSEGKDSSRLEPFIKQMVDRAVKNPKEQPEETPAQVDSTAEESAPEKEAPADEAAEKEAPAESDSAEAPSDNE